MIYLLHQALDESASRLPDHAAMRFQGQVLTYAQLAARANQLAAFLYDQGVRKHDRIGIFLDKSLETVIALYGIMKAGAAYVPLDPRSPVLRLLDIIADCGLKGIITQENKRAVISDTTAQPTDLQFLVGLTGVEGVRAYSWDDVAAFSTETFARTRLIEQDLAYIMYTSGSTGKPKGMMHTHASGLSYTRMSSALYNVTHEDRLSNHSPLHFDMSTFDYLTGVVCGATTTIIPEAYTLFPVNLAKLIESERLTIWYSVPFALVQLLLRGGIDQRDLSSIRWVLYGGEPFPLNHLRALMERMPNAQFSNVYGPAEMNHCTVYTVPPPDTWTADMTNIPIGKMVENADGLLLDEDDQPVAVGEAGELVVRAPTMMRGYWNRPDLNTRAFYKQTPFPNYEMVYYRTGDLVRQRPDGLLEFIGRKDHQVKIRGFRVELPEVEAALTAHQAVAHGAAFVLKGTDGADMLAAAVVLHDGAALTEMELTAFLRERLTHYAVPDTIYIMETFPRTGTGKVDRAALAAQVQSAN